MSDENINNANNADDANNANNANNDDGTFEIPEKFKGKELKDVVKSYVELERLHTENANKLKELEEYVLATKEYYKINPETGAIEWDKDALERTLEALGGPSNKNKSSDNDGIDEDKFVSNLQENPKETIKNLIADTLKEVLGPKIEELENTVKTRENETIINKIREKHPDFDDFKQDMLTYIKRRGLSINTYDDLEDLYYAVKSRKGGFVDKKDADKQATLLKKLLEDADSVLVPGTTGIKREPKDESVEEYFGIESASNTNPKEASMAIFGKPFNVIKH